MAELHKKNTFEDVTLTWYKMKFDDWLYDFKNVDAYGDIVNNYERRWSEIYKELHRRFKETIWNPTKLADGYGTESAFRKWRANPKNHQRELFNRNNK